MADEFDTASVTSASTDVLGRTVNTARHNHFVIDSPAGPGEALSTGEAFLSGIAACGVTLVQHAAKRQDVTIEHLTVDATYFRAKEDPDDFHHVDVHFTYTGVSTAQAESLTDTWKAH